MEIKNPYIRFCIFYLFSFLIFLITDVYFLNSGIINQYTLLEAIQKSLYIALVYPSSLLLSDLKKRDSITEFRNNQNILLISIFLFIVSITIIPKIIKNNLTGIDMNWTKSLLASFALALFALLLIYLLSFVQNRNKNSK
jgi:energy-coupling factor transporter transmembrane protein EcfT